MALQLMFVHSHRLTAFSESMEWLLFISRWEKGGNIFVPHLVEKLLEYGPSPSQGRQERRKGGELEKLQRLSITFLPAHFITKFYMDFQEDFVGNRLGLVRKFMQYQALEK